MNVIDKPGTHLNSRVADFDRFRLRRFIEGLGADQLDTRSEPHDLASLAEVMEGNQKAVLFRAAGPEKAELVGNVSGDRARLASAFGVKPAGLLAEIQRRLGNKPEIFEVTRAEAPCQQVVLTGDDADVTKLPVHLQHGADGGPYISASIDYVLDPKTGFTNVGLRRLMLRSRHETGVDLVSPSDLKAIYEANAAAGKRTPVSFVVGAHPIDHVAGTMRLPVDEIGIVAMLRDAPLAVVKSVTNDIRVPADAEYVIEGYLDERGHVEAEGPYGEFLGYYGAVKRNPVFHVTAITHRKDALFQTSTIGGKTLGRTDTAQLSALRTEVAIWTALQAAVREPVAVYATTSSGGAFNVRVAIRQRVPGEARNAIGACMGALANCKNVFVVDPDVDIFSDEQMDWAMATRFQPDRDLIVMHGMRTLPLDPSLPPGVRVGAKAGYDLTWPFGTQNRLEVQVPAPPKFEGKRFASVEAALADGPKYFEELMTAVGSRDGREVVRTLGGLRDKLALDRDGEGRYFIKK
ncbi:UbiD family decarboxylase [Rhodoplanes sp. Z2-YC6860]|uniref:UbiD family decarboxylase n=1 Tax=Rhodoplanes sp. Z2-YC6860 TaxID=674703 RepID=UPI00078D7975|nr:UbiD family decarboxylase [Rhodoplanes sp. Z2-YC6860]AMN43012.1 UbiD family decarboxylase [Rhodoplanes sp. Z2-YC6860]